MANNIKVAVRTRPYNKSEINTENKDSGCIKVLDKKIFINSGKPGASREFTFDYCYSGSEDATAATQDHIYRDVGSEVLECAFDGYNSCVFAYGQTGSGKTYTMLGSNEEPGLIPGICEKLFLSANEKSQKENLQFKVEVSYMEVYNEVLKDLLRDPISSQKNSNKRVNGRTKEGMKLNVREDAKKGIYVENLRRHLVTDYTEVQHFLKVGSDNRSVGSTLMNSQSSRSHAIFTLYFTQACMKTGQPRETSSKIHLVDLAGSERVNTSNVSGKRLTECQNINKSLSTLALVISTLSRRGSDRCHIPYRNSVLTRLLKDSIGGNCMTIMIATISPARQSLPESLSTLRYAKLVKAVVNTPSVNEDPTVKMIRELREQIAALEEWKKNILQGSEKGALETIIQTLDEKQQQETELTEDWKERWTAIKTLLSNAKLNVKREGHQGVLLDAKGRHLLQLEGEDKSSIGVLLHPVDDDVTLGSSADCDVILKSSTVLPHHCSIVVDSEREVSTLCVQEKAFCVVNQMLISDSIVLSHGDILVIGSSFVFKFQDPGEAQKLKDLADSSSRNLLTNASLSHLSFSSPHLNRSSFSLADSILTNQSFVGPDTSFSESKSVVVEAKRPISVVLPLPETEWTREDCELILHDLSKSLLMLDEKLNTNSTEKNKLLLNIDKLSEISAIVMEKLPESENEGSTDEDSYHTAASSLSNLEEPLGVMPDLISSQHVNPPATPFGDKPGVHREADGVWKCSTPLKCTEEFSRRHQSTPKVLHSSPNKLDKPNDLVEHYRDLERDILKENRDPIFEQVPSEMAEQLALIIEREVQKRMLDKGDPM